MELQNPFLQAWLIKANAVDINVHLYAVDSYMLVALSEDDGEREREATARKGIQDGLWEKRTGDPGDGGGGGGEEAGG